jgi:hypothetical protein
MKGGHERGCYPVDVGVAGELLCSWFLILHDCAFSRAERFDVRRYFRKSNQAVRCWFCKGGLEFDKRRRTRRFQVHSLLSVVLHD